MLKHAMSAIAAASQSLNEGTASNANNTIARAGRRAHPGFWASTLDIDVNCLDTTYAVFSAKAILMWSIDLLSMKWLCIHFEV